MKLCCICESAKAAIVRPKNGQRLCRECFYEVFEEEVHQTIIEANLFKAGEKVAIGASGGKGALKKNSRYIKTN